MNCHPPIRRLALLLFMTVLLIRVRGFAQSGDFSIVVMPDMQNETQYFPQVFSSGTQWIANNRSALNIQAVLGLGDIVNVPSDTAEWSNADAAIKVLDQAQIPYFMAIGNHDYDSLSSSARSATAFNQWFGPLRYRGYSWYKGNYNNSNENFYGMLNIGGRNFLFLVLEFVPRDVAVDWAKQVMAANPTAETLVVTHSYMFYDGTRVDQCDTQDLNSDNYGDKLWAKFVSQYANIDMVFSGHMTGGLGSRRADLAVRGNLVNQMFSNYQTLANGGNGYLRILTFHPMSNTVDVKTYSPYLNTYKTDAANQFTIYWHAPAITATTGTISGLARDVSTCKRIAGAQVKAGAASAVTDTNGHYNLTLPAGSYTAAASVSGYTAGSQSAKVNNGYDADTNFFLKATNTAPCTLNITSPSVTICAPVNNATVTSPVQVIAGTTDSNPVSYIQLYVDGVWKVTQPGGTLNVSATLSSGTHRLTVQAKDSAGVLFKQTIYAIVSGTSGQCVPSTISPSVTICSPQPNATVTSPVNVVALSTDSRSVTLMQVYVDGLKATQQSGGSLNVNLLMASGNHRLTVQAVDSANTVFKQTIYITVQ